VVAATSVTQRFSTPGSRASCLGLAEPVHLVDEQHGLASAPGQVGAGLLDGRPHLLHPGGHRRYLHEGPVGLPADDRRDRGLAGAGRTPQQQGQRLAALDQLAQR
jgi:hypothetical protein